MKTGVVVRGSGFTPLTDAEAIRVARLLDGISPALAAAPAISRRSGAPASSAAEAFGRSVRELHALYAGLVDAMGPSRTWVALQLHSTAHTAGAGPTVVLEHFGEVQVTAYGFDPAVFLLPWQDNTLDHPWRPWGFVVAPFSDDADDAHAFVELRADSAGLTGRATLCPLGAPDELRLAQLAVALPVGAATLVHEASSTPVMAKTAPSLFEVLDAKVKQQPSLTKHNMARVDLSLLLFNARGALRDLWIAAERERVRAAAEGRPLHPTLTAALLALQPIFGAGATRGA